MKKETFSMFLLSSSTMYQRWERDRVCRSALTPNLMQQIVVNEHCRRWKFCSVVSSSRIKDFTFQRRSEQSFWPNTSSVCLNLSIRLSQRWSFSFLLVGLSFHSTDLSLDSLKLFKVFPFLFHLLLLLQLLRFDGDELT